MPLPAKSSALFVADAPALDFLNSIATPTDEPVDWLSDGEGLVDWLRQAGLVPLAVLDELASLAMPGELDRVADQARDLREWLRDFVGMHMGRPLDVDAIKALAPVNRLLARDEAYDQIIVRGDGGHGRSLVIERTRRWRSPETLLMPIGEAIAQLIVAEDFAQIKACQGRNCTLMFADHTRAHARRWCSMSVCGNRAKVAAHRSRQKGA